MTPHAPHTDTRDDTAVSAPGHVTTPAPGEHTDAGAPTEATIIRAAPGAKTVNDKKPDANSFGKYELLGEIARGGMGVVYRAKQHGLDRIVALKMILGTGTDQEAAQRFLQEARAAAALDHPNVVPIYDTGEIDGRPYFTMALIDGPNLRGYADGRAPLPIAEVVTLFAQVVEGVAHAHKHGIVHRDLKPANVLIDRDGRARVTDFGLAKRASAESQLTMTGQVVGTPQYMAPEQARDSKDAGLPADVYSLGAILYFLLTGRPPFHGESFTDLLLKVVNDPPEPPRAHRADVPADLDALCLRCLAKKPAERFPDAGALADAFAPVAAQHLGTSAHRSSVIPRAGLSRPSLGGLTATEADLSTPMLSGPALSNVLNPASAPDVRTVAPPAGKNWALLACVGVVGVALVGAAAYFATRDGKKEVAKQDPPPPADVAPMPRPADPKPQPQPQPAPLPADKFAWPDPTRADFGLKVDPVAAGMKKDADGRFLFLNDSNLELHLTAAKDCRVSVWLLDPSGVEERLFPNEFETDDRLVAGQPRVVPGKSGGRLELSETLGAGIERIRVIATTGDAPAFPPGTKKNQFTVYATAADRERLASTVRGVVLKKAGAPAEQASVAEAELRFRVGK
jgi:serine/threonine protein kinase